MASNDKDFKVPYSSFTTLTNTADRMAEEGGVPSRVDRSYLSNLPGGEQTIFIATLKSLGLVNENLVPTPILERMVAEPDARQEIVKELLEIHYSGPLGLGARATQAQLEDEFRKFGISGSTMRRAIGFFLAATRFAEIKISDNFKLPKRPPKKPRNQSQDKEDPPPRNDQLPPSYNPLVPLVQPPEGQMHPFIIGLLQELPPDGGTWTQAKRQAWLEIAERTIDMLYKVEDAPKTSPPISDGGE